MKEKKYYIYSFIFVSIIGTLLHFVYEISGENLIIASFAPVNESTWEHLKLIFFPMLISGIIGYFIIGRENSNYICSRVKGIFAGMFFIVVFFYTYTGILGTNIDFLNIASFFVGVFIAEYISYKGIKNNKDECNSNFALYTLILVLVCFIIFTYIPPEIGIFEDPISGNYGISSSLLYQ